MIRGSDISSAVCCHANMGGIILCKHSFVSRVSFLKFVSRTNHSFNSCKVCWEAWWFDGYTLHVCTCVCLSADSSSGPLKEHLVEELDYYLLSQPAWEKLVSWYGVAPGSCPIARSVSNTPIIAGLDIDDSSACTRQWLP